MDMAFATRAVLALTIVIVGHCVYLVARPRSPRRLFLIDMGRDLTRADRTRVRRVLAIDAAFVLVGLAGAFGAAAGGTLLALSLLCPLAPVLALVIETTFAARTIERAPVPEAGQRNDLAVVEPPPGVLEYVSPVLQTIHVAIIACGISVFVWLLGRLPERVPVHWNAAGEVDRWGSPATHWAILAMVVFDWFLMWGLIAMVARERWALPAAERERYAALQRRRRTLMVRMTEWIFTGIDAGFVAMWLLLAASALPGRSGLAAAGVVAPLVVMAVAILFPLACYLPKQLRVEEALRAIAGTVALGTREDGWRWGGMIYYAPGDPAVFVPKRIGIGQTINCARPVAWIFLGAVVAVPLALTIVLIVLAG